jgi:hypothetical protein
MGRWIEFACGVKSETINLDRRVKLRCTWTSFLSEEILGCILRVSLEYTSRVSGYDTSTWYCLDSLSIPGWLKKYGTGSVSWESRSWERFSCAIDCKLLNIDDSVNIPNSFMTLVSGAPEIDTQQGIGITLGSSGTHENTELVCRFRNHNSTYNIWSRWAVSAARQILTQRNIRPHGISLGSPWNWRTSLSLHFGSSKWGYDSVYQISVYHWHQFIFMTIII